MSQLRLLVLNEIKNDLSTRTFWVTTFIVPLVLGAFGAFAGVMMEGSDSFLNATSSFDVTPETDEITPMKVLGMMLGIFPVLFLMIYGSTIFNKVKTEKCNRIVEVIATCVEGKTMMLSKIISVGVIGLIQLSLWFVLLSLIVGLGLLVAGVNFPWEVLGNKAIWLAFMWALLYFTGGYVFYGSLFASVGAMTDRDNENQGYVGLLTFVLLASFYIGEYAVDHSSSGFVMLCSYVPFTSPTVLTVVSASGEAPLWLSLTGLAVLFFFAFVTLVLSGKLYTSSLLLKGKKFSPKDIITFIKAK